MKGRKALEYILGGAVAAGSLISGGCRAAYVQETPTDRAHYAVYEKNRMGKVVTTEKDMIARAEKGLEVYAEAKPAGYDFRYLGDDASFASRIEANNARAKNALAGADAALVTLYDTLNKKVSYKVDDKQLDNYYNCSKNLEELASDISKDKSINHEALMRLKNRALASGNKELAKNVSSMVDEFISNLNNLKVRTALTNAFYVSEGMFDQNTLKSLGLESYFEGITTGISDDEISSDVLRKCKMTQSLDSAVAHMMTHVKRNTSIDPDEIVRVHRYEVVKAPWDMYASGALSGKELTAAILATDKAIAARAIETPKDGMGKKFLKHVGGAFIPLFPFYKAGEAGSHLHHEDTAAGFAEEKSGNLNVMGATMEEVNKLRLGATNGDWVVGRKSLILGDTIIYSVEAAGQLVGFYRMVNGGGSSGGSSGGSNPQPAPAPDPWVH